MFDRLRLGMQARLLLAFATLILPLALFAAWSYQQTLDERRDTALEDQVQFAQTAGAVVLGILRDFDTTMLGMAQALAGQQRPLSQETVGPLLAAMSERYPFVRAIFLLGPDGRVLASPSGQTIGTDLSGQPYTRAMLGGEDLVLTDVIPGAETGAPIIVMGRRVEAPDGGLRGMLAFAFYPSRLQDLFPGTLPPDAILNIVDRRGTLIFSSAGPEITREARDFSDLPMIRQALGGEIGATQRFTSPIDREPRLGAAVPVSPYGWAVSVSRTRAAIEGRLDDLFRRQLLVIGAVTTAALVLAWLLSQALARPLARLADEAKRLGHGELGRPVRAGGPPEVRDLAGALNAMAAELQTHFAEREAALEETRDALAIRDQFLSIAAHELRTPLTALKGQVQLARRRLARGRDPAGTEAMLERAESQVDRLAGLVNDLLDVARISAGGFLVEPEPVAPAPVIRRVAELERAMAPGRTVEVDLPRSLPVVRADEARLEQVLLNLLENARKYSPDGSPIRIGAAARDGWLEISVRDEGAGIPPDEQRTIFDRFKRASNVDRNISGLGLGLYIVREIVEAHGGRLDLESAPGAGSTFCVLLPVAAANDVTNDDGERVRARA